MALIKKNRTPKGKVSPSFKKRQSKGTSFQAKIERANKLLSETIFIKKPVHC